QEISFFERMNLLKPRIPKGLRHRTTTTPKGLRPFRAARRFMESHVSLRACIGTMNLKSRIPKGFRLKAQGCRVLASPARTEATLGWKRRVFTTLRVAPDVRYRLATFMERDQGRGGPHSTF